MKSTEKNFGKWRGLVQRGSGRGKGLGFPTLNLKLQADGPASGVYAVQLWILGQDGGADREFRGVMHVGPRPSFNETEATVEIHVFDFHEDLLEGTEIDFVVGRKLREVQKFSSPEELVKQIQKDVEEAKKN